MAARNSEGAPEKGGIEGQVGYYRRNHFVPVPEAASLTELNAMVDQWDLDDEGRRLRSRTRTIGKYFAQEQPLLRSLPREAFETGRWFTPRVNRFGQVTGPSAVSAGPSHRGRVIRTRNADASGRARPATVRASGARSAHS
ncbi:hypothetical protein ACWDSD_40750 [Streptomyces spiralis]